jgi:hypothetical protein
MFDMSLPGSLFRLAAINIPLLRSLGWWFRPGAINIALLTELRNALPDGRANTPGSAAISAAVYSGWGGAISRCTDGAADMTKTVRPLALLKTSTDGTMGLGGSSLSTGPGGNTLTTARS